MPIALQPVGVVVHLTSQVAWEKDEGLVDQGDLEVQTRKCFENIRDEVGGTLEDVVSITTYFTDRSQLASIQRIRNELPLANLEPAFTSVMVTGLGHVVAERLNR